MTRTAIPTVLWLAHAQAPHDCEGDGCTLRIAVDDPVAWERDGDDGRLLCLDCGAEAEDRRLVHAEGVARAQS